MSRVRILVFCRVSSASGFRLSEKALNVERILALATICKPMKHIHSAGEVCTAYLGTQPLAISRREPKLQRHMSNSLNQLLKPDLYSNPHMPGRKNRNPKRLRMADHAILTQGILDTTRNY